MGQTGGWYPMLAFWTILCTCLMGVGMFYEMASGDHGLPHNPIKACVVPRPIGWITSISASGVVNLAPYSFFNLISDRPSLVAYGSSGRSPHGSKDTVTNIAATGEFVVNMATWAQRDAMHASSAPLPPEVDEMLHAGLRPLASRLVRPPRVEAAPVHLECVLHRIVELPHDDPDGRNTLVIGKVVGVHIDESVLVDGQVDVGKARPIARLGYQEYACIDRAFTLGARPTSGSAPGSKG